MTAGDGISAGARIEALRLETQPDATGGGYTRSRRLQASPSPPQPAMDRPQRRWMNRLVV